MNTIETALAKLQEISNELAECPDTAQLTDALYLAGTLQQIISAQRLELMEIMANAVLPILKAENDKKIKPIKS